MKVLQDVFPAVVLAYPTADPALSTPTRLEKCRVIVTDSQILVARDSDTGPVLVFRDTPAVHTQTDRKTGTVVTTSGKRLEFSLLDNCGCGSRLRSWNPYRELSSTKDPTE